MSGSESPPGGAANRDRRDRLLAIGEIAAEVAHELRNALQIVSANVYLARQNPTAAEPHLAKIERSTRIAQGIVDDLMALARGEAVHAEPIPVVDLLPLGREWLPAGPAFEDSVEPATLKARAHAGLVPRLFHVLYENAIKAKATRITTTARAVGSGVQIEISDDGPGVPESIRDSLFEPLVSARSGGSGLGLALARRIVEAHHGAISLVGPSTFRIELPNKVRE
ncbi:MAG: HAMP domain-containing sensor histidine kinase [Labilithrix sp.]